MSRIIVAKPGYNVLKETNPDNLNFSSDYNTLKYFLEGSITIKVVVNPSTNYIKRSTVLHNLGYTPFYIAYVSDDVTLPYEPVGRQGYQPQANASATRNYVAYVDSTSLYVSAYGNSGTLGESFNVTFYYKIFKNNLNL